jgi:zinc transporter 1/2/3
MADASECGGGHVTKYNMPLGIASIFIVALVSFAGFLAPSLVRKAGKHARIAVVAASAMGTGVILAVSLVHILADAEEALSSPCLPQAWLDAFPNWGVLFTTVTMVCMIVLDYILQGVFERKFQRSNAADSNATDSKAVSAAPSLKAAPSLAVSCRGAPSISKRASALLTVELAMHGAAAALTNIDAGSDDGDNEPCDATATAVAVANNNKAVADIESAADGDMFAHDHGGHGHGLAEDAALALKRGAVVFIEASVCTHSIPVGLALGLQGADTFLSLFIAVIVHQVLEGLGVGAAAMDAQYKGKSLFGLASGFALTAPIGIALGVGLHSIIKEADPRYLFSLGIVNAIAAGMLLYVAVEHMNALSSQGAWLRKQHWSLQLLVIVCFAAGAAAMIGIGRYA